MSFRSFVTMMLGALICVSGAKATVTYTLTSIPVNLSLTVPDFITSDTTFPASVLDSCTPLMGFTCDSLEVTPEFTTTTQQTVDLLTFLDSNSRGLGGVLFWFAPGAFDTPGTYDDEIGHTDGVLTVSVSAPPPPPPIPEPDSWTIAALGSALVGALTRRRRRGLRGLAQTS